MRPAACHSNLRGRGAPCPPASEAHHPPPLSLQRGPEPQSPRARSPQAQTPNSCATAVGRTGGDKPDRLSLWLLSEGQGGQTVQAACQSSGPCVSHRSPTWRGDMEGKGRSPQPLGLRQREGVPVLGAGPPLLPVLPLCSRHRCEWVVSRTGLSLPEPPHYAAARGPPHAARVAPAERVLDRWREATRQGPGSEERKLWEPDASPMPQCRSSLGAWGGQVSEDKDTAPQDPKAWVRLVRGEGVGGGCSLRSELPARRLGGAAAVRPG